MSVVAAVGGSVNTTTAQAVEVWVSIPGFSNYEACSNGQVRNKKNCRLVKPYIVGNYYRTSITNDDGVVKHWRRCRLMATAFNLPKRVDQVQVDHINGDHFDDRVCNLRWRNASENMGDRLALKGTISDNKQVYLQFESDEETIYFKSIQESCRYFQRSLGTMWGVFKTVERRGSYKWHQWKVTVISKEFYDSI